MHPPRWAEWAVLQIVPPHQRDAITGDLLEEYRERLPAHGQLRAEWWYVSQVASFLWPLAWPCVVFVAAWTAYAAASLGDRAVQIIALHTFGPVEVLTVVTGVWAGVRGGQTGRNLKAGPVVAASVALVVCYSLAFVGGIVELFAARSHAHATIGPFGPLYVGPSLTAALAAPFGFAGGILGKYLGGWRVVS